MEKAVGEDGGIRQRHIHARRRRIPVRTEERQAYDNREAQEQRHILVAGRGEHAQHVRQRRHSSLKGILLLFGKGAAGRRNPIQQRCKGASLGRELLCTKRL